LLYCGVLLYVSNPAFFALHEQSRELHNGRASVSGEVGKSVDRQSPANTETGMHCEPGMNDRPKAYRPRTTFSHNHSVCGQTIERTLLTLFSQDPYTTYFFYCHNCSPFVPESFLKVWTGNITSLFLPFRRTRPNPSY
jgi:hypothetical protein